MRDTPENAVILVDTYDTVEGVRRAIAASRETGVSSRASGSTPATGSRCRGPARAARPRRHAGRGARGQRRPRRAPDRRLVAAGAPVDVWGVGTDLGTSRDSPTVGGVYKLVADRRDGAWRRVAERSPDKATLPGPKQVFRHVAGGVMREDVLAVADERLLGRPLLEPVMRDGTSELRDPLRVLRARAAAGLRALPRATPYPVMLSDRLARLTAEVQGVTTAQLGLRRTTRPDVTAARRRAHQRRSCRTPTR